MGFENNGMYTDHCESERERGNVPKYNNTTSIKTSLYYIEEMLLKVNIFIRIN